MSDSDLKELFRRMSAMETEFGKLATTVKLSFENLTARVLLLENANREAVKDWRKTGFGLLQKVGEWLLIGGLTYYATKGHG